MKNPFEDKNLTRAKLRKLIQAGRKRITPVQTDLEFTECEWEEPHHFDSDNFFALEMVSKKMSNHIKRTMETLCQVELEVQVSSMEQYYASTLCEGVSGECADFYFLPFTENDEEEAGFVMVSPKVGATLVAYMLRDLEFDNLEEKVLSELEESILMDVITAILESFAVEFRQVDIELKQTSKFSRSGWPLDINGIEDMAKLDFAVKGESAGFEVSFVIRSSLLDPLAGKEQKFVTKPSPEQISNLIMKAMHKAPVEVLAQITAATMYLKDLLELQKGDILLLRRRVTEPIDVLLNRKPCLKAYPAQTCNRYSLVITEPPEE